MITLKRPAQNKDLCFRKAVRVVQDFVKKRHKRENIYKRLMFLTSSQSVPEMLNNDSENSSLTSSSDGCCNDTGDSIFNDDLQLNWSAFTPEQTKKVKKYIRR